MKKLFLSSLIFLFIFFCTFIVFSSEKIEKFQQPYSGFTEYESDFNPHSTLRMWTFLKSQMLTPDVFHVVVGNPKIDWSKLDSYNDEQLEKLRVEVYTVHYGFMIEADKDGTKHLFLYIYVWKNERTGKYYRCIAKPYEMYYKIEEVKNEDKEEVNIKRFLNDFRYLQVAWY